MITPRQLEILTLIVDLFAQNHEPVGSKALQGLMTSSSATIRNDMARLEKLGLLEKAHTSSGRLPSLEGFQYFVDHCLTSEDFNPDLVYQVMKGFDFEAYKLDDILKRTSQLLADLTGYTAIVLDVEPRYQRLTAFDIVAISSHDALAILTLDDSKPVTVQFAIPRNFLLKDLVTLKELVTERFLGQNLLDIHYRLRTEIPQIVQKYFRVTDNVLDLCDYLFAQVFEESVFVAGKVKTLDYARQGTYQFLDNSRSVALAIRQTLSENQQALVQIAQHPDPILSELTVISHKFLIPYRGFATMAVIGPVDMDYRRTISLVKLISQLAELKLRDYYRYLNSNHYEVN